MLAAALPGAFALSPRLRVHGAFSSWIFLVVPAAIAIWRLSGGRPSSTLFVLAATSTYGAVSLARQARRDVKVSTYLAVGALLVMAIAYFSSGRGGSEPMIGLYERYGLTEEQARILTLGFRKTVHFTFYGTFAWLALQAVRAAGGERSEGVRTALLAALAVASFDELRQSAYANRSGSPWDVLLDCTGALVFVGLSEWRRRKVR